MSRLLKIGDLAKQFSISPDTIRYYERNGLLTPNSRSQGGYRLYDSDNRAALAFIMHAKSIGFTLSEIRYLLEIDRNKEAYSCRAAKAFVDEKRQKIQQKMSYLQRMNDLLTTLSDSCQNGELSAQYCPILESIEEGIGAKNEE